MKKLVTVVAIAAISTSVMGAASECSNSPGKNGGGPLGAEPINVEDGEHTISELGKWKYGTKMEPSSNYPQCHWEVWGLQNDGWRQLYTGSGYHKVQLPPPGVYGAAKLKSTSCGHWDPVKKK